MRKVSTFFTKVKLIVESIIQRDEKAHWPVKVKMSAPILILFALLVLTFSKDHRPTKWGTEIIEGLLAKSETLCATYCSSNETCSSYLYNEAEGNFILDWNAVSQNEYHIPSK